jgi:hypothetical protein
MATDRDPKVHLKEVTDQVKNWPTVMHRRSSAFVRAHSVSRGYGSSHSSERKSAAG